MPPRSVRYATTSNKTKKPCLLYTVNNSLSESTHKCVFTCQNSAKDQVPDGVSISRRTMTCVARCLVSLPIAESGPVAMTERSHRAR